MSGTVWRTRPVSRDQAGHSTDAPREPRVWNATTPEGRLSIATYRFLKRALVPPFYVVAVPDSDHGTRSDQQRISRDAANATGRRPAEDFDRGAGAELASRARWISKCGSQRRDRATKEDGG